MHQCPVKIGVIITHVSRIIFRFWEIVNAGTVTFQCRLYQFIGRLVGLWLLSLAGTTQEQRPEGLLLWCKVPIKRVVQKPATTKYASLCSMKYINSAAPYHFKVDALFERKSRIVGQKNVPVDQNRPPLFPE